MEGHRIKSPTSTSLQREHQELPRRVVSDVGYVCQEMGLQGWVSTACGFVGWLHGWPLSWLLVRNIRAYSCERPPSVHETVSVGLPASVVAVLLVVHQLPASMSTCSGFAHTPSPGRHKHDKDSVPEAPPGKVVMMVSLQGTRLSICIHGDPSRNSGVLSLVHQGFAGQLPQRRC